MSLLDWKTIYNRPEKTNTPEYRLDFYKKEKDEYVLTSNVKSEYLKLKNAEKKDQTYIDESQRIVYCAVEDFDYGSIRKAAAYSIKEIKKYGIDNIWIDDIEMKSAAAEGIIFTEFKYDFLKKKQESEKNNLHLNVDSFKARAQNIARFLTMTPPNLMTPTLLSNYMENIVHDLNLNINVEIFDQAEIEKLDMNLFMSVAKGSEEKPKLVILSYLGKTQSKIDKSLDFSQNSVKITDTTEYDIIMVGKGITFDSGGLSLKPPKSMFDMKGDMMGAATIFGSLLATAQEELKVNVKVIIPICENLPSGKASKPSDVVFGRNGKSVEILNTDAEGRLILADGLNLAEEFSSKMILTASTLTGAAIVALGNEYYAIYTNDDEIYNKINIAGEKTADIGWRMPLNKKYMKLMKSDVADFANVGFLAGSPTAAAFLNEFVEKKEFVHLDIAPMLDCDDITVFGKKFGGRPCSMLYELLKLLSL